MRRKVFLVQQNIDHLYGDYFVAAVVLAHEPEEALALVAEDVGAISDDDDGLIGDIEFDRERCRVTLIGLEAPDQIEPLGINQRNDSPVLVLQLGKDYDV